MDSYDVLVIVLAIALAVSTIVWIVAGVLIMQVVKKIKTASSTAQHAVENVEAFTSQLKNAGRATAVGSIIKQVTNVFKGRDK